MYILLPTDVFPPRCGGAGWSAHALALALIWRGHRVTAIVPQPGGAGVMREQVLGVPTVRYGYQTLPLPFVKNYARHERLWPRLTDTIVDCTSSMVGHTSVAQSTIIHAQHVQTAPPAIMAGQRLGVPVVVTVRDHWPWDYFATGLHGDRVPHPQQTWASLAPDLMMRLGPVRGLAALPAIPYMLAHVRRRQQFLRQADAVIAVSQYIAERVARYVPAERVHVIPNMVDVAAIERTIATPPQTITLAEPFLLFVGKLERNKGAHQLIDVFRAMRDGGRTTNDERLPVPQLVVCGDGPLRAELERELTTLGVCVQFLDWIEHDEVLRLMARCALLLFPSAWGEPLSRVLLEASACAAPILAMPTGGTPDIITDGVNGALAPTPALFAERLAALLANPLHARALGAEARCTVVERFSAERVLSQVEALYRMVTQHASRPAPRAS